MGYNHAKYKNVPVVIDGIRFQSTKEGKYYSQLKLLKKAGEIKDFKRQVCFSFDHNNVHIAKYYCDFVVEDFDGNFEYIDVKGFRTREYRIKKQLMLAFYGIKLIEP